MTKPEAQRTVLKAAQVLGFRAVRVRAGLVVAGRRAWVDAVRSADGATLRLLIRATSSPVRRPVATNPCEIVDAMASTRLTLKAWTVQPSAEELATFWRGHAWAARHGVAVPPSAFELGWYDPDDSRTALGFAGNFDPIEIGLQRGRPLPELFETVVHELLHADDMQSGLWPSLTRGDRERRAYLFQLQARDAA